MAETPNRQTALGGAAVVGAVLAILTSGCGLIGSDNQKAERETGIRAAKVCLERFGASKLAVEQQRLFRSVAGQTAKGSFVYITSALPALIKESAVQFRDSEPVITWITPDKRALLAIDKNVSFPEWQEALKCALLAPNNPGKENFEQRDDRLLISELLDLAVLERICDLEPDSGGLAVIPYALERHSPSEFAKRSNQYSAIYASEFANAAKADPRTTCPTIRQLIRGP